MLILSGPESRIELDILGYQFPSAVPDGWDSEWLQVLGRAECPRGRWKFYDPCLRTSELEALASWFRKMPSYGPNHEIGFLEPNLRFEHVEEVAGDVLYIWFSHEASPPWVTDDERLGTGYALRIPFSSIHFIDAAAAIEELCRKYPDRTSSRGTWTKPWPWLRRK